MHIITMNNWCNYRMCIKYIDSSKKLLFHSWSETQIYVQHIEQKHTLQ